MVVNCGGSRFFDLANCEGPIGIADHMQLHLISYRHDVFDLSALGQVLGHAVDSNRIDSQRFHGTKDFVLSIAHRLSRRGIRRAAHL